MKVATINGCKDCPFKRKFDEDSKNTYWCLQREEELDIGEIPPATPHPECKLPDLPTDEEIRKKAVSETHDRHEEWQFIKGGKYVINVINSL